MSSTDRTEHAWPPPSLSPAHVDPPTTTADPARQLVHDLRNALQPVLMAANLLQRRVHDAQTRQLCETIRDGSLHALALMQAAADLAAGYGPQSHAALPDTPPATTADDLRDALYGNGEHVLVLGADAFDGAHLTDILDLYGYAPERVDAVAALAAMSGRAGALRAAVVDRNRWPAANTALRAAGFAGAVLIVANADDPPVHTAPHIRRPVTAPALLRALRAALSA